MQLDTQSLAVADAGLSLEAMAVRVPVVAALTPIGVVDRLFSADRRLSAVIVERAEGAGLLPRDHVLLELSGRFGYGRALHSRSTAADLVDADTMTLPTGLTLAEAAHLILERPWRSRYQDVLVHTGDGPQIVPVSAVFERLAVLFHHAALHDPLTGLPNRRLLELHGADLARHGFDPARIAILYIDLDGFKAVNDTHGHRAGDELLIGFATRLRNCVRDGDLVARLGGDEFAALLLDVSDTQAAAIADRIVLSATAPFVIDDQPVPLSASVGIAMAHDLAEHTESSHLDLLLRHADTAMLLAKNASKRQVTRPPAVTAAGGSLKTISGGSCRHTATAPRDVAQPRRSAVH